MIEYRVSEPADRDAVLRFMCQEMSAAQAAAKAATFDWEYGENPHDDGSSPFILAFKDRKLVGVRGVMPARLIYKGRRVLAAWSIDTRVAPEMRNQGIASELMRWALKRADVVLGYGVSDSSNTVSTRAGLIPSRNLAGYALHLRQTGAVGALKNLVGRLSRLRRPSRPAGLEVNVERDRDLGADVDRLWSRSATAYVSVVERDAAYMNWKYRRHPLISYRWYSCRRNGELAGVLIARPDPEISVIADYCGPLDDDAVMTALVDIAIDDLNAYGTKTLHCQTTDAGMARALRWNGFHRSRGNYRLLVRCNFTEDPDPCAGLFVMPGDSDQDFSTLTSAPAEDRMRGDLAASR